MNTNDVWEMIGKIPVGTIVAWAAVIIAVLFWAYRLILKLFRLFKEYNVKKEENEEMKKTLTEYGNTLQDVNHTLNEIKGSLAEQKEVNLKQLRYSIVGTCDEALSNGYITAGKLKSVEEMYEEYLVVFHGNGYVKTLVEKVREVPVKGRLEE